MTSLSGKQLPPLTSISSGAERYLEAILEELQWQRAQKTPPPETARVAKPVSRVNKVEEIRGPKAA